MINNTLVSRDNKGKIRVLNFSLEKKENNGKELYVINRSSGLFGGTITQQPSLEISKGKVKRTLQQQAELEYNALIKKALDKGYKDVLTFNITDITEEALDKVLPKTNTDQNDAKKPMLCKLLDKTNKRQTDKAYLASYKLDGVRCSLFWKNGEVRTSSRGGQDYDIPTTYIRKDAFICKLLSEHQDLILDGELYFHGWNLATISGLCRKESLEDNHKLLQFHCYDIIDETKVFKERAKLLKQIKDNCPNDSKLIIVDHFPVQGLDQIMKLHNKAVSEGYEGLVVRDPEMVYKCGARDNRMLKVKEMVTDEFKILGIIEGLREEDMCFLMETKEGYQFKAKPTGTREEKQEYRKYINDYIGHLGTVKYFGFTNTEHPVPNLPVFIAVRLDKDL